MLTATAGATSCVSAVLSREYLTDCMCGCADESVYRALEQLTRLQHLELYGSRTVVSCKLLATSPAAAGLRTLRMQHSALDVRDMFLFVFGFAVPVSHPRSLNVPCCGCSWTTAQLPDACRARLAKHLSTGHAATCGVHHMLLFTPVTQTDMAFPPDVWTSLESLDLSTCCGVSTVGPATVEAVCQYLTRLTCLDLGYCNTAVTEGCVHPSLAYSAFSAQYQTRKSGSLTVPCW